MHHWWSGICIPAGPVALENRRRTGRGFLAESLKLQRWRFSLVDQKQQQQNKKRFQTYSRCQGQYKKRHSHWNVLCLTGMLKTSKYIMGGETGRMCAEVQQETQNLRSHCNRLHNGPHWQVHRLHLLIPWDTGSLRSVDSLHAVVFFRECSVMHDKNCTHAKSRSFLCEHHCHFSVLKERKRTTDLHALSISAANIHTVHSGSGTRLTSSAGWAPWRMY